MIAIQPAHPVKRRGAAAVEFALVAPLFLLVVFGIIEVGRMVMVQQVLTNASREGARVAVLNDATTSDVQSAVSDYLADSFITTATENITVTPNPATAGSGAPVTVSVTVAFEDVSWFSGIMILKDVDLQASATMRKEIAQ